jgi:transcriptional regulator with XRE-family HTH domain
MEIGIDYKAIGMRIKSKRVSMGLTQEKLSEIIGVGIQHLSKIENGKAPFSLPCLVALSNALNTTADHLLMDNIMAAKPKLLEEVSILLEDCTHNETYIILRTATSLKESLKQKRAT